MLKTLLSLIIISVSFGFSFGFKKKPIPHTVVLGIGGEPEKKDETIFDLGLNSLNHFFGQYQSPELKNNITVSLNGGHKVTEQIISQFPNQTKNKGSFTPSSYQEIINEKIEQIQNGTIAPGDRLLIVVDSHGGQRKENELTHSISVSGTQLQNYSSLTGSMTVSLDQLQVLSKLAEEKGIKLGIIDLSCHSGNTLALANSKTCVVSASGPEHFAFSSKESFANRFLANLKRGRNLEEIFKLAHQEKYSGPDFPMISTPAGLKTNDQLYSLIKPYLFYEDKKSDKLRAFIEKGPAQCFLDKKPDSKLEDLISEVERIMLRTEFPLYEKEFPVQLTSQLRASIARYHQKQLEYKALYDQIDWDKIKKKEIIKWGSIDVAYSILDYFEADFDKLIAEREIMINGDHKSQSELQRDLDYNAFFKEAKKKKEDLLIQYPELSNYQKAIGQINGLTTESYQLAFNVSQDIAEFYRKLYDINSKKREIKSRPNPCQEFEL